MRPTPQRVSFEFELTRSTKKKTLDSGNQMLNANDRMHYMVKSPISRYLRDLSNEYALKFQEENEIFAQFDTNNPCFVIVTVCPPTKRHMDAPNWYPTVKPLLDGMTDAEIFSDDNDKIITSTTFIRGEQTRNGKYTFVIDIYPGTLGGIYIA